MIIGPLLFIGFIAFLYETSCWGHRNIRALGYEYTYFRNSGSLEFDLQNYRTDSIIYKVWRPYPNLVKCGNLITFPMIIIRRMVAFGD